MADKPLYDRAMFWVAVAAVLIVAGGIPIGVTVATARPADPSLWDNLWFLGGVGGAALGVLALTWAIILHLAHGHAVKHHSEELVRQSGKRGASKVAPYRLAVDTLITWIFRRKEWLGLSTDGKYREPAPKSVGEGLYSALGLSGSYTPVANIVPEPGFDGPGTDAPVGTAGGTAAGLDASVRITDSLSHRVIPGPTSPTLDQVGYQTEGRRHFVYSDFHRRPKAVRFSKPEDRLLRATDLPFEMSCGNGELVVEKFYCDGLVLDEIGTTGDPVAFIAYFDD